MKKASPAINKINFILFINLLALIVIINVSAISLNNELGSLDASLDKLTDDMRRYNESYPTVHLVEFSDLKNIENTDLQTGVSPFVENITLKNAAPTQSEADKKSCQSKSGKELPAAGNSPDKNVKGPVIDQVAIFIIATPVIAFFLLVSNFVGMGITKLIRFFY